MTATSNSYIPRDAHQPRGKNPWCANCDTDRHLVAESPAVTGRQAGTLVVAVHCSNCRRSRVLDTTEEHLTALPRYSAREEGLVQRSDSYFHCGEPMFLTRPRAETTLRAFFGRPGLAVNSLATYFSTEVLRCRGGFQIELPR
ncbi:hypothetical protein [Arthrobacter globiformis]|uniref:hypothetical protein n=1 Tax=Arthrobacter globiformis TaxID=1665 RepID=UPI002790C2B6|nr:hypothetical protein [Arthrobacter globiformis]MDQ0618626.1 hypothetical protein [Arthrobacter globiformis]